MLRFPINNRAILAKDNGASFTLYLDETTADARSTRFSTLCCMIRWALGTRLVLVPYLSTMFSIFFFRSFPPPLIASQHKTLYVLDLANVCITIALYSVSVYVFEFFTRCILCRKRFISFLSCCILKQ